MVTLVVYYSYTGRTHYEAKRIAERIGAELYEVREQKHRSHLNAYLLGPVQARRRKEIIMEPIAVRMEDYDKVIIMSPIWGGWPAPAFSMVVRELTPGINVEVYLTSDSGKAKDLAAVRRWVELRGAHVNHIQVIKTIDLKERDRLHVQRRLREIKEEEERAKAQAASAQAASAQAANAPKKE